MPSNGRAVRADLASLALKVAEEFDKMLRGEAADRTAVERFGASLKAGIDAPSPAGQMFLHNHRTIGAFTRALQRAYHSRPATVEELNRRVPEEVQGALTLIAKPETANRQEVESTMEFFIALHRELLMQQFPLPAAPRIHADDESVHG